MTKFKCYYILLIFVFSCSAEKINISPLGDNPSDNISEKNITHLHGQKNLILYSSEITNLISSFPKFRSDGMNHEVRALKSHLRDYISAMKNYNMVELEKSYSRYERSYKKIQKLRRFLNPDEDKVLNRYLVRIKINMNHLQSNLSQQTVTATFY